MFEIRVPLTTPLPLEYGPELERRIFFVSPDIVDFKLVSRGGALGEIVVVTDEVPDRAALAEKVNFVVENDLFQHRVLPPKVIWVSGHRRAADERTFTRLAEKDLAVRLGEGQVALGQPVLALMDYFDEAIRAMVTRMFGAREYRYPTLIPTRVLEACGYFDSFPQQLMFVTRLHNDVAVYREFQEEYTRQGRMDASLLTSCRNVDYCLPPTMCFHTFGQYGGRTLDADEQLVVTSRGKSFRFESRYAVSLERLWDFTIREVVFVGRKNRVLRFREELMAAVFGLMDELGLAGDCEVGNDPFFLNSDTAYRTWSQRLMELKYELRLDVAERRNVAVASFNFHDKFFGERCGISFDDGGAAYSGCAGFGLERLAYAFLCQYGLDQTAWPLAVADGTDRRNR